jgi:hypothetical protein
MVRSFRRLSLLHETSKKAAKTMPVGMRLMHCDLYELRAKQGRVSVETSTPVSTTVEVLRHFQEPLNRFLHQILIKKSWYPARSATIRGICACSSNQKRWRLH